MDRYKALSQLGDGSYGSVWKAINRETGEVVAVKRMKRKYFSWEECMSLREVRSLRKLSHPCIVKLKEVVRENNDLFFIFEYLEHNLYQVMKQQQGRPFPESRIRLWMFQILQGLDHMHRCGFFHRDMKPENLLVHGERVMKIADFGLARETLSEPPYTEYVSTRWYRAPEVLLRKADYSAPVDMFAAGAIMAELFMLRPLFPGSTEIDELCKIAGVLGSFTADSWPEGEALCKQMGFRLEPSAGQPLRQLMPGASDAALDLIQALCQWQPTKRPTAAEALQHPFFEELHAVAKEVVLPVLRERTNTATATAAAALTVASPRQPAGPAAAAEATVRPARQRVDWMPMHTSMQAAALRRKPRIPGRAGQQVEARRDGVVAQPGQPPDLWVNARGIGPPKPQPGFAMLERGAPLRPQPLRHHPPPAAASAAAKARSVLEAARLAAAGRRSLGQGKAGAGADARVAKAAERALSHCRWGPDVALGDFRPLSASLRKTAAARSQRRSGL